MQNRAYFNKKGTSLKISIITVCLNVKNEIERTLLSVFNQTYENFELIVIDGVSTDGTIDVIEKYKNKISVFVSEPDTGIYNAMNKGVERASGDFLVFLNAGDELYDENVLKNIVNVIARNNDVKFIFGDAQIYSEKGLPLKIVTRENINNISSFLRYDFIHQSCFYHKSLFENKKYDETFKISGDSDFNLNYVMKNNFPALYYPVILSKFYLGGISSVKETREVMKKEHKKIAYSFYSKHPILRIFYDVDSFLKRYFNSAFKYFSNLVMAKKIAGFWTKNPKYKLNVRIYCGDK